MLESVRKCYVMFFFFLGIPKQCGWMNIFCLKECAGEKSAQKALLYQWKTIRLQTILWWWDERKESLCIIVSWRFDDVAKGRCRWSVAALGGEKRTELIFWKFYQDNTLRLIIIIFIGDVNWLFYMTCISLIFSFILQYRVTSAICKDPKFFYPFPYKK